MFERGDLRNSLREKRAARDREQQRAMLENKQGGKTSNLGLTNFKVGWRGDCKITWMYSPAHFYIQVVGDRARRQFEDMMGHLQEVMRSGGQVAGKVSPGQVVAARWTHDNCWYRGQVMGSVKQGKVEVFFVDFGNTERLDREDLGVLPPEFCNLDCQAVRVMLDGIEADWDKLDGKLSKYFDKDVYGIEFLSSKDKDGAPLPFVCKLFILLFCLLFCLSNNKFSFESPDRKDSKTEPTALFFNFLDLLFVKVTSRPSPIFLTILTSRLELIMTSLSLLSVKAGLHPKEQMSPNSGRLQNSFGRLNTWFLEYLSLPPTSISLTSTLSLCSLVMIALKYLKRN